MVSRQVFKSSRSSSGSTKCQICDNTFVEDDAKVRYLCHVTGKYRCAAHRDCNINVSLNDEIPIKFQSKKLAISILK